MKVAESNYEEIFTRLGYAAGEKIPFKVVFFDEAHKGGITKTTQSAIKKHIVVNPPFILMTATYKKLLDDDMGYIKKQNDLFIWDLDDVRLLRRLPDIQLDNFILGGSSAEGDIQPYSLFNRYEPKVIKGLIQRRLQLGETYASMVSPYVKFPDPYFLSATFTPKAVEKLMLHQEAGGNKGFSLQDHFSLQKSAHCEDIKALLDDHTKVKEWHNALQHREKAIALRSFLTPNDDGETNIRPGFDEDDKIFNRIFAIAKQDSPLAARPQYGVPHSIIMFLPTGKPGERIGATCRAWASLLLLDNYWANNFIILGLSEYKYECKKSKAEEATEEATEGGARYELFHIGGAKVQGPKCLSESGSKKTGYCSIENIDGKDLKEQIVALEAAALKERKGLVILTGDRAKMGISLPCVDVVCMFDNNTEADDIIQKMYRALTDSPGKKRGFIVDLNPKRIIKAKFEYAIERNKSQNPKVPKPSDAQVIDDIIGANLWDVDAWTIKRETEQTTDFHTFMQQIKSELLDNIDKDILKLYEKDTENEDIKLMHDEDFTKEYGAIFELLGHNKPKKGKKRALVQGPVGPAPPSPRSEESKDTESEGEPEPKSKSKPESNTSEPETQPKPVLDLESKKKQIALLTRHFVNILVIRTEAALAHDVGKIDNLMKTYKENKVETITKKYLEQHIDKTLDDCAINNIYYRVFHDMKNFVPIKDSLQQMEATVKIMAAIERRLQDEDVKTLYSNYLDAFIRNMRDTASEVSYIKQTGGHASSDRRYNEVLQVIDDYLVPDKVAKEQRGEVFTPPELVRQMLFGLRKSKLRQGLTEIWGYDEQSKKFIDDDESDRSGGLPNAVWSNPKLTWLDPANGIGNFPIIAFYKLDYSLSKVNGYEDADVRRKHIIEKMLFMMELDNNNNETCRGLFKNIYKTAKPNIYCGNSLEVTDEILEEKFGHTKFDMIMGNPPFNTGGLLKGGGALWPQFVKKAFELVNNNGYICFVHPPGWRKFYDSEDRDNQGKLWYIIRQNGWNLDYVNISDKPPKHFPIVDYYVIQAKKTDKLTTYDSNFMGITDSGETILDYPFIPNMLNDETTGILKKLFDAKGEPIHIIYNQAFKPSASDKGNPGIPHYHFTSRTGEKQIYKREYASVPEYIVKEKVIMTYNGGYEKGKLFAFYSDEKMGTTNNSMYMLTKSKAQGDKLVKFLNSDIITFLMKITQYSASPNHKNEFKILNQLHIPDSLDYGLTVKEKDLIERVLRVAAPKNTTRKAAKPNSPVNETRKCRKKAEEPHPVTGACVKKCTKTQTRNMTTGDCIKKPKGGVRKTRKIRG
jgi:hypothetical protein